MRQHWRKLETAVWTHSAKGDEVWVQNRITGVWDKDAVVLGQRNGGA